MENAILGILSLSLIGLVLAGVLVARWLRSARRNRRAAAGTVCPECGGDLGGYDDPFTCPHCYAILGDLDADDSADDSADEPDEDDDADGDAEPWA